MADLIPPPVPVHLYQICHRSFARSRDIRKHIAAVHKRTRPYVCRICGRAFQRRYKIRLHIGLHPLPKGQFDRSNLFKRRTARTPSLIPGANPIIQHPTSNLPAATAYQRDRTFQQLKNRFLTDLASQFPNTPYAYCGTLHLTRNVCWEPVKGEIAYPIQQTLDKPPHIQIFNGNSKVAVCKKCLSTPKPPITGEPWPSLLTGLPQHTRIFLSPLTLQTNLGRTQGAQTSLNPYVTYRTVTDKLNLNIIKTYATVQNPTSSFL
jgi:hypothetical protein